MIELYYKTKFQVKRSFLLDDKLKWLVWMIRGNMEIPLVKTSTRQEAREVVDTLKNMNHFVNGVYLGF